MRILVHDYAGHAFAVELSRSLASRGHEILHAYCASNIAPRGVLRKLPTDPPTFDVRGLHLGSMIPKSGYLRRLQMEYSYGQLVVDACEQFQPDVVLSGQTPSIPQWRLTRHCRSSRVPQVLWVQDAYGLAAYKLLSRKLPGVGHAIGKYFLALDRRSARHSDSIVVITDDFRPMLDEWGIDPSKVHVIHNWPVLADLPVRLRDNPWSQARRLKPGVRFIYSGTLAMKHNPALLLELAKFLDTQQDAELVVCSEGAGVDWLQEAANVAKLRSLTCFPYQPFEQMADVLGSADVLVAILEADAGAFSVPSKVLSYMCAGRPILGAMPRQNLAAKLITANGAGVVVEPDDFAGFCEAARKMVTLEDRLADYGTAARQFAEANFQLDQITDRFERILLAHIDASHQPAAPALSHADN